MKLMLNNRFIYKLHLFLFLLLAFACEKDKSSAITPIILAAPINESKVYKLFVGMTDNNVFEASGIKYVGDHFYVVFDNSFKVANIDKSLSQRSIKNTLSDGNNTNSNYEGITYDYDGAPNIYALIENESHKGEYSPEVCTYDVNLHLLTKSWLPYSFMSAFKNKGFEGLVYYRRNNKDYLLGLSEASGNIVVTEADADHWNYVSTIELPSNLGMDNFSDIDISAFGEVAVTSQQSSKLWIGKLSDVAWQLDGDGIIYEFPKGDENGEIGKGTNVLYGNVEGVSFMSDSQIVICSDMASNDQAAYQTFKAQTISIFNIPK